MTETVRCNARDEQTHASNMPGRVPAKVGRTGRPGCTHPAGRVHRARANLNGRNLPGRVPARGGRTKGQDVPTRLDGYTGTPGKGNPKWTQLARVSSGKGRARETLRCTQATLERTKRLDVPTRPDGYIVPRQAQHMAEINRRIDATCQGGPP